MKRLTFPLITVLAAFLLAGCKTNRLSPLIVQQGVATGVAYSVLKYPSAVPYLKAATPVVCAAGAGTNISPAAVVASIEGTPLAEQVKTPEGVLILNSALLLYTGIWESYGSNAVANSDVLKEYLVATCNGMNQGLAYVPTLSSRNAPAARWPKVKF